MLISIKKLQLFDLDIFDKLETRPNNLGLTWKFRSVSTIMLETSTYSAYPLINLWHIKLSIKSSVSPYLANVPISYPLKTTGNL